MNGKRKSKIHETWVRVRVRFTEQADLQLLKEVLASNPYKDKSKWSEIGETISSDGFTIDSRRAREKTALRLAQHKKKDSENKKKSGVDEIYDEKASLLDDILSLKEEEDEKKNEKETQGQDVRKRALENLSKVEEENTPKKRTSNTNIMDHLRQKSEQESENRTEELRLRSEELKLEREKFKLEKQERKQRLEVERQEKTMMFDLLKKFIK